MIAICYNQKEVQEHIEHFKHLIQEKNDQSVTYVIPFFKKNVHILHILQISIAHRDKRSSQLRAEGCNTYISGIAYVFTT